MKKLILLSLFVASFCFVNAQVEQNDSIKLENKKKEFIDPIYGDFNSSQQRDVTESSKTPGDYIIQSARLKLIGVGLGITTSTLFAAGAFEDMPLGDQTNIAIVSGVVSLAFYISGELTIIKAGKLMNEERVSVSVASEGVGLVINF